MARRPRLDHAASAHGFRRRGSVRGEQPMDQVIRPLVAAARLAATATVAVPAHAAVPTATDWLRRVDPDHRSWQYVWKALPADDSNPELVALATEWLDRVGLDHPSWSYVW